MTTVFRRVTLFMRSNPARLRGFPVIFLLVISGVTGCASYPAWLATSGPLRAKIEDSVHRRGGATIRIIDIDGVVAQRVADSQKELFFGEDADALPGDAAIGPGDGLEIMLWEAPPAALFGASSITGSGTGAAVSLPSQVVDSLGEISIPFAGKVYVSGKTPRQIEADIARLLNGKANQPQVFVRVANSTHAAITVVGEVGRSAVLPLTPRRERILDVLAAAQGVRQPVDKITIQLTRGDQVRSAALDSIIREPAKNIILKPGDIVTALHVPLSFSVLGATGRNEEVSFEARGISLAQGLARVGGVQDSRADAAGVFIFRFEHPEALGEDNHGDQQAVPLTADGRVPVVYRANLKDPATFFVAQKFPIRDKDLLYVSNASAAELQKFLNVIVSAVYPVVNLNNTFNP